MSDIKRTALIVLIVTLLFSYFINSVAYAANYVDHDAMMEYPGYGEAMYESIVEQTTFISGQYTDNKEYVNKSVQQVKDYANFWSNELDGLRAVCGGMDLISMSCLGDMAERAGAYTLTVGDWIKNLFNDYDDTVNSGDEGVITGYASYFMMDGDLRLVTLPDYLFNVDGGSFKTGFSLYFSKGNDDTGRYYIYGNMGLYNGGIKTLPLEYFASESEADKYRQDLIESLDTPAKILGYIDSHGVDLKVYRVQDYSLVIPSNAPRDNNLRTINNYIKDNPVTLPLPQLQPTLVCPDGTKIKMSINGSAFLSADGKVMLVSKDGTAEVNGSICNLNWQKPTVSYDPITGNPIVIHPDGTKTDLETGDSIKKPPSSTDLEGCDGVLCGIGKLLDGLGGIVSAITGLVSKLLDGILSLFVPEDLDFISDEFSRITKKLNEKIAITEKLKEMITSIFVEGSSNPLENIVLDLPILDRPVSFGNVSFINEGVPTLRKVMSAIAILYTILYVYRKITGRGGVMEK